MPVCVGGSQPREGSPLAVALTTEGLAALVGLRYGWLGFVVGLLAPYVINVEALCATDPPDLPEWTVDDVLAIWDPLPTPQKDAALSKLVATVRNVAWYQLCECVTGTAVEPGPTPPPAGVPVVDPVVRPPLTGSGYAVEVLVDEPAVYWRCNERGGELVSNHAGGDLRALVGYSSGPNNPTIGYSGPASDGGSLLLNGGQWAGAELAPLFSGAFTWEFWAWIPAHALNTSGTYSMTLPLDSGLQVEWWSGGQFGSVRRGALVITGAANPTVGIWRLHCIRHTGTALEWYIDGVFVDSEPDVHAGNVFGYGVVGGTFSPAFVSEIAIYPGLLSPARMAAHMAAASLRGTRPTWQGLAGAIGGSYPPVAASSLEQLELVRLIQRQGVPFAYVEGPSFGALTGDGEIEVQGILGIAVQLNAVPLGMGTSSGTPDLVWEAGRVALGTVDGYLPYQRITSMETFMRAEGYVTKIGYTLGPGVVATIRTFVREP